MSYKKYIIFILFVCYFHLSFAYNDNEIESFYYIKTIETISKYVDEQNTTLWFLYEYEWFLTDKIEAEFDKEKLSVLYKLSDINKENIKKQLLSLDLSKNNVDLFIKYFEWKNPEYQKYIDLIKISGVINSKDELWNNLFTPLLKNGTYDDIDFALNRWLNPNNKAINWDIAFYDFIKTGGKFYPSTYLDKLLAGTFDEAGTLDIINNFILKWFNVNLVDNKNESIIYAALDLKNIKILETLFKNKHIHLQIKNIDGKNPLFYAIEKWNDKNIILELIRNEQIDINATDNDWNNLTHIFSNKENDYLKELFKRNIHINHQNKLWETEMMKIVMNNTGETDIIDKYNLLQLYKPLDLNLKDQDGYNLLMKSIQTWKMEVFKEILKTFENIKDTNNVGQGILSIAATGTGNIDILKEILKLNIDINAVDIEGNSALHYALENTNYDIITELLKSGIDINILNKKDENIFTFIIENNDIKLLNLSLKFHGDMNKIINKEEKLNVFLSAVKQERWDLVKIILKNKNELNGDINSTDILWQTALNYAIIHKNLDGVKLLLANDIHVNTADINWKTPLMFASETWDTNIVNTLISFSNTQINQKDNTGKNALIYACIKSEENIIKTLIDNKIDTKIVDNDGKKCIDYIKESKNISKELFEYLK